jgi:hypothetical protein
MGLDRPLPIQYWIFLKGLLRLDFGKSLFMHEPALALVLERFPATIQLTLAGMLVAVVISIPLGVIAAVRRYSLLDNLCTMLAVSGQAMPVAGTSFNDSPVPTPRMMRPGNIVPSVPKLCATIAGWRRNVGVSTLVPSRTREVRAAAAPSHATHAGACPPVCRHGWKWSLMKTESKPAASASVANRKSSAGPNCSADAFIPA